MEQAAYRDIRALEIDTIDTPRCLLGGGDMGAAMRALAWNTTPLRAPEAWPAALRTLVSVILASDQPMFIAWGTAQTLLYNDAYAVLLGRKHPAALGRPILEVWAEAEPDLRPLLARTLSGQAIHMDDITLWLDRYGSLAEAHFAFSYTPVHDEHGHVAGVFCVCSETTAGVMADQRCQADLQWQRRLFEQAPGCICILRGPEHVFEFCNAAFSRLTGHRDTVDRTLREVFPGLEGQGLIDRLDRVNATGQRVVSHRLPLRLETMPGTMGVARFLDIICEPILDEDGLVTGIFFEASDVTDQKLAEDALQHLNQTLEQQVRERTRERDVVWRTSRDLFLLCGFDGIFRSVNPACTEALGYAPADIVGLRFDALIHPDDLALTRRAFGRIVEGEIAQSFDNRVLGKDGTYRCYSWNCVPEGDQFYAAGRDVTIRNRLEKELRLSQKMQAVGQLAGGLADDFNDLVTSIRANLDLIADRMRQGRIASTGHYIDAAQDAATRTAELTHRLSAFSRRQTLAPQSIVIDHLVRDAAEIIRTSLDPAIALEVLGDAEPWPAFVDPGQLQHALLDVCRNAREAMPSGGHLIIETANKWLDEPAARERGLPPGEYVLICVSDNGIGMAPDAAMRAFDPFFTTKPVGTGSGLSLAMVYGFVQQSGGQARLYSEPGEGTTVCLYFPRHIAAQAAVPGTSCPLGAGEMVLVIGEAAASRMLVSETLEQHGFTTVEAASLPAGARLLRSGLPLELVVTEIGQGNGLDSREIARTARALRPDIKLLLINPTAQPVPEDTALEPGLHLLSKPFELDVLASRVRDILTAEPRSRRMR